jgi:hypothetical protein
MSASRIKDAGESWGIRAGESSIYKTLWRGSKGSLHEARYRRASLDRTAEDGCPHINHQSRHDFIGAHHFVVFVLEDVAVPDVAEFVARLNNRSGGKIEFRDDAGD